MPRPALTNEQKRAIRSDIRRAAARLYAKGGADGISARAVAQEAGVSVGTLYAYFEDLSGLMQSLWREPTRRLLTQMEQIAAEFDSPDARLHALLTAYVAFAREQSPVFRSAFLFVRPESKPPPKRIALAKDRFFQLFCTTISAGQDSGLFRDGDPNELAQIVFSAVHGSLALPVNLHRLALDTSDQIPVSMIDAMVEWLQCA